MSAKMMCSGMLTVALVVTLGGRPAAGADRQAKSRPTAVEPQSKLPSQGQVDGAVVGAVVGAVAGAVVVVYLLTRKKTITGCVNSTANGLNITDQKDKAIYALAGNSSDIPTGHRVKLQGKKLKMRSATDTSIWQTEKMTKDLGVCPQ